MGTGWSKNGNRVACEQILLERVQYREHDRCVLATTESVETRFPCRSRVTRLPSLPILQPNNVVPDEDVMAKTQRKLKKANHGKRPASAQARRAKRKHIKT